MTAGGRGGRSIVGTNTKGEVPLASHYRKRLMSPCHLTLTIRLDSGLSTHC